MNVPISRFIAIRVLNYNRNKIIKYFNNLLNNKSANI